MKLTEEQELIVREWIAALRSGKYKQGKGFLRRDGEFCCLGVLCDIHAFNTGVNHWSLAVGSLDEYKYKQIKSLPPQDVMNWAGINRPVEVTAQSTGQKLAIRLPDWLVQMNDEQGKTFNDIADFIEETFFKSEEVKP